MGTVKHKSTFLEKNVLNFCNADIGNYPFLSVKQAAETNSCRPVSFFLTFYRILKSFLCGFESTTLGVFAAHGLEEVLTRNALRHVRPLGRLHEFIRHFVELGFLDFHVEMCIRDSHSALAQIFVC